MTVKPTVTVRDVAFRGGRPAEARRTLPEETAVAFTYDGSTHAVMMATPADLEDFAVGFTLTEGIVAAPSEIADLAVVGEATGIELRMRLAGVPGAALVERRRHLAGPVGCGLCGIESLDEAMRPVSRVRTGGLIAPSMIRDAVAATARGQRLNHQTSAVHAAGFWRPGDGIVAVREDVGRHNALDKLAGALARRGEDAAYGLVVVTSRLSVELVQKAAMIGATVLVAVSAPTALAVRTAEAAGMTLAAIARDDGFEVFTGADRIVGATVPADHVAS